MPVRFRRSGNFPAFGRVKKLGGLRGAVFEADAINRPCPGLRPSGDDQAAIGRHGDFVRGRRQAEKRGIVEGAGKFVATETGQRPSAVWLLWRLTR